MMAFLAPVNKGSLELPKEEIQRSVIVELIDLGMKENKKYNKIQRQLAITFELVDDLMVNEKNKGLPFHLTEFPSHNMGGKATLRAIVHAVLGKQISDEEAQNFDVKSIVGKSVMVQVYYKPKPDGNKKASIASYSPVHKSMKNIRNVSPLKLLVLSEFDHEVYDSLPEWKKKLINLEEVPEHLMPKQEF